MTRFQKVLASDLWRGPDFIDSLVLSRKSRNSHLTLGHDNFQFFLIITFDSLRVSDWFRDTPSLVVILCGDLCHRT